MSVVGVSVEQGSAPWKHTCMLLHNVVVAHCYMVCIKSGNFSNNGTLCKDKKTGCFGPVHVILHRLKLTCYKREGDVCIQMVEYVISRHPHGLSISVDEGSVALLKKFLICYVIVHGYILAICCMMKPYIKGESGYYIVY